MNDAGAYAERLRLSNQLLEPVLRSTVEHLALDEGSRGLAAGCGIGLHTVLLALAVGSSGYVTGLDVSADFLALAGQHARRVGV